MVSDIIRCIKGCCEIKVSGRFPERILNAAAGKGVFVENVTKTSDGALRFSVSRRGCGELCADAPEGLDITVEKRFGLPFFLLRHRRRVLLFFMPAAVLLSLFVSSLFIWNVRIVGGDKALRAEVSSVLEKNGVYRGALKHKIDRYGVKNAAICSVDDLSWLWVDIKGTTATVKIHARTAVPKLAEIKEPANVIATENCVIEQMQVFCGRELVSPGMTVEKGSVIITGVLTSENELVPTYYRHACGIVRGRVWREKAFSVPKTKSVKTPTGRQKNVYTASIKKNINFSLNSGISYTEYDKIREKIKLPLVPVTFSRTTYREVTVENIPNDTEAEIAKLKKSFEKSLVKKGGDCEIAGVSAQIEDRGSCLSVKLTAEMLMRIDKEVPVDTEEHNGENI